MKIEEVLKDILRAQRTNTGIRVAFIEEAAQVIEERMEEESLLFAQFVGTQMDKDNLKEAYKLFKKYNYDNKQKT